MSNANHSEPRMARPRLEIRSWWGRLLVGRRPVRTFFRLIVVVAAAWLITQWWFVPIRVTGRSMEPTYRNGRLNVINLLAYHRRDPQRSDVVAIRLKGHRLVLLKRVIGLPEEKVRVAGGRVIVNGSPLNEPYARGHDLHHSTSSQEMLLGPEEYFVIGDNRDVSEYGVVQRSEIRGKVLF